MRAFQFAWGRNTSVGLLIGVASVAFAGCGETNPDGGPSGSAGMSSQAGTAGTAPQGTAGMTSAAGMGNGGANTGTAGASNGGNTTAGAATAGGPSGAGTSAGGAASGGSAGSTTGGNGGSGGSVDPSKLDKFSFFVTSMAAMRKLSKSDNGFGGDLRYGTADGLTGADKICTEIAESSMAGSSAKQWHAFLSTTKVNAKDRIGAGPWYDRRGRLVAENLTNLLQNRPNGADPAIKEDLPNETGTPNHRPNPAAPEDDNHHTLTGSKPDGTLYSETATCLDWTTTSKDNKMTGRPRIGFCWSTQNRTNWISGQDEGGCGAGVTGVGMENGGSDPNNPIVGSGGGYGAIYCFATVP